MVRERCGYGKRVTEMQHCRLEDEEWDHEPRDWGGWQEL